MSHGKSQPGNAMRKAAVNPYQLLAGGGGALLLGLLSQLLGAKKWTPLMALLGAGAGPMLYNQFRGKIHGHPSQGGWGVNLFGHNPKQLAQLGGFDSTGYVAKPTAETMDNIGGALWPGVNSALNDRAGRVEEGLTFPPASAVPGRVR